jgi:ribosomal protein S17
MVSLSEVKDADGFIVSFWCNTCPVVKKYDQRLQDLHAEDALNSLIRGEEVAVAGTRAIGCTIKWKKG